MTATDPRSTTPPLTVPPSLDAIPIALTSRDQWVGWRWILTDQDRWTKEPVDLHTGKRASSTNPRTWAPFALARAVLARGGLDGIGFVFSADDPFTGIDADGLIDRESGELKPELLRFMARCPTYWELSPSGTGAHAIVVGTLPDGKGRKAHPWEAYDRGRFFTVTGHGLTDAAEPVAWPHLAGWYERTFPANERTTTPPPNGHHMTDAEVLNLARSAKNGADFTALYERGDLSGYNDDESAADLALMSMLTFWIQDPAQLARLFSGSALGRRDKWRTRVDYRERTITRALNRAEFYDPGPEATAQNGKRRNRQAAQDTEPLRHFALTDTGNAERLVAQHGKNLHYSYIRDTWFVWDGRRWAEDAGNRLDQLAKATVRTIPAEAEDLPEKQRAELLRWAATSESASKRSAMIDLARSEPGIPVSLDTLDADPWLLNVANGTVDLRTGALRPHRRDDLITTILAAPYDPKATCPRFLAWLNEIMLGRGELVAFLQRALGYSLTGKSSERVIFVLHGAGRNGKTTLLETVSALLVDYARSAPAEMLLVQRENSIPNDLARLPGRRFVSATETGEGRRLDEVKVKAISGGDTITARFLFREWFDFRPTFKLWLGTNHRPEVRGTDNAIWDRIRLIPFDYRVPDDQKIPDLADQFLRDEAPGILAWLVAGCMAWQRDGLQPPAAVLHATEQYRRDMDPLANWLEDRCEFRRGAREATRTLYADYVSSCEAAGEEPLKQRTFGTRLTERGCGDAKSTGIRYRTGIRLLNHEEPTQATFDDDAQGSQGSQGSQKSASSRESTLPREDAENRGPYGPCDPRDGGSSRNGQRDPWDMPGDTGATYPLGGAL